jgi:CSLREA domain-containing protein
MATFTVNTTNDIVDGNYSQLSLREAVQQANITPATDTIQFAASVQGQTLTLTGGELVLMKAVVIHGDGVTIDGNDTNPDTRDAAGHRILNITGSGTDVRLDNLTLTRGSAGDVDGGKGGAILLGGGSLTMTGCTVTNNTSTAEYSDKGIYAKGGGIYATAGSRLTITDCRVTDNYSGGHGGDGGGISAKNATVTIRDSQLSGNEAYYGGGAIDMDTGRLTIENCVMDRNIASAIINEQIRRGIANQQCKRKYQPEPDVK